MSNRFLTTDYYSKKIENELNQLMSESEYNVYVYHDEAKFNKVSKNINNKKIINFLLKQESLEQNQVEGLLEYSQTMSLYGIIPEELKDSFRTDIMYIWMSYNNQENQTEVVGDLTISKTVSGFNYSNTVIYSDNGDDINYILGGCVIRLVTTSGGLTSNDLSIFIDGVEILYNSVGLTTQKMELININDIIQYQIRSMEAKTIELTMNVLDDNNVANGILFNDMVNNNINKKYELIIKLKDDIILQDYYFIDRGSFTDIVPSMLNFSVVLSRSGVKSVIKINNENIPIISFNLNQAFNTTPAVNKDSVYVDSVQLASDFTLELVLPILDDYTNFPVLYKMLSEVLKGNVDNTEFLVNLNMVGIENNFSCIISNGSVGLTTDTLSTLSVRLTGRDVNV